MTKRLTFGIDRLGRDGAPMFDPPPSTADENSQAAALSMVGPVGSIRRRVAEYIDRYGPVGTWEIERDAHMKHETISARVWELYRAGVIDRHPAKGTTPSGRSCWRYVVTESWHDRLADLTT